MQELRQSTEMKVRVGCAMDATDGVTPETTLGLGAADQAELLKHNGVATVDISGNTFNAIANCGGWYDLTLTAGNTDTLGQLTVVIQDSSLMTPIFRDFMVLPVNVWDSKYSTDKLQVDVTQVSGTSQTANDNGADINAILVDTGTTLDTLIKDIPTVAEFNARSIVSADYVVVGDTIAGVTTVVNLTNAPTAGDLTATMKTSVNTEADTALTDYDSPTRTEMTTDKNSIITEVDANETKIDTIDGIVDAIKTKTDALPSGIAKNVALSNFSFLMILSSDHITPATGKTIVATISKNGAAFVSCANAVSEIAAGVYKIDLTQAEMNYDIITLKFTETDCDQRTITLYTV